MFDLFDKCRKMLFFQEGEIGVFINLLPNTKVVLGNVVHTNQMVELSTGFLVAGDADSNNVGITRVVQNRIGIVNRAIYSIGIDSGKIRLVLGSSVSNISFGVQFDKLIFVSLILNQNWIVFSIISQ